MNEEGACNGVPRIDPAKVKQEERLDGKCLLRTSNDSLSVEDVALGYKQLVEVEEAFRTLKSTLNLRPVYHRLEERIKAHTLLCWLALLLIRVVEVKVGESWPKVRARLERIRRVTIETPDGQVVHRSESDKAQKAVFSSMGVEEPKRIQDFAVKTGRTA